MDEFYGVPEPSNLSKWTRAAQDGWRMGVLDALEAQGLNIGPKCPYTHAHTKHWCGYEGCRES